MALDDYQRHPHRPLIGLFILLLPLVLVVVVVVLYTGVFGFGFVGRPGSVPTTLVFDACPEALEVVRGRLEDMGYAPTFSTEPGGFTASFAGPSDTRVTAALPGDLARGGRFEVRGADVVLATEADVVEASVRVDAMMVPTTLVRLEAEAADRVGDFVRDHPPARLDFYLDGARIGGQANSSVGVGEVEIAPPIDDPEARIVATAAYAVIIDHAPLPCPVSPRSP